MDWGLVAAAVVYFVAVAIVAVRERAEDWDLRRRVGMALFLLGAGLALFLDDLVASAEAGGTALLGWSEPIGALVMLVGGVLVWASPEVDSPGSGD